MELEVRSEMLDVQKSNVNFAHFRSNISFQHSSFGLLSIPIAIPTPTPSQLGKGAKMPGTQIYTTPNISTLTYYLRLGWSQEGE